MKIWIVGEKATDRKGVSVYARTYREAAEKVVRTDLTPDDFRLEGKIPRDFKYTASTRKTEALEHEMKKHVLQGMVDSPFDKK